VGESFQYLILLPLEQSVAQAKRVGPGILCLPPRHQWPGVHTSRPCTGRVRYVPPQQRLKRLILIAKKVLADSLPALHARYILPPGLQQRLKTRSLKQRNKKPETNKKLKIRRGAESPSCTSLLLVYFAVLAHEKHGTQNPYERDQPEGGQQRHLGARGNAHRGGIHAAH
jgi:hypothetical protein